MENLEQNVEERREGTPRIDRFDELVAVRKQGHERPMSNNIPGEITDERDNDKSCDEKFDEGAARNTFFQGSFGKREWVDSWSFSGPSFRRAGGFCGLAVWLMGGFIWHIRRHEFHGSR